MTAEEFRKDFNATDRDAWESVLSLAVPSCLRGHAMITPFVADDMVQINADISYRICEGSPPVFKEFNYDGSRIGIAVACIKFHPGQAYAGALLYAISGLASLANGEQRLDYMPARHVEMAYKIGDELWLKTP